MYNPSQFDALRAQMKQIMQKYPQWAGDNEKLGNLYRRLYPHARYDFETIVRRAREVRKEIPTKSAQLALFNG